MATSPDFVRLATTATRPLAEAIFDALRDAVLVVDLRLGHLPARAGTIRRPGVAFPTIPVPVPWRIIRCTCCWVRRRTRRWSRPWRRRRAASPASPGYCAGGFPAGSCGSYRAEISAGAAEDQRLLMLSFAEPSAEPGCFSAIEQLPLRPVDPGQGFDGDLCERGGDAHGGALPGGILSYSGLTLVPDFDDPAGGLQSGS